MVVALPPSRGPSRDTGTEADVLRVSNLGVRLDHVPILEGVSFHVRRGTTLAIVGPNGAGKTTLFRVLLGLVPHTGTVNWSGPVRIGYVPQNFVVTDVPITVLDFLGFKSGAGFEESLAAVGLGSVVLRKRLDVLSGGEMQRVLIAWAVLDRPNVLLFDAPTATVDIGSLMVLKRMALVGDALSHVALPGLALGLLFNFNPFLGAFGFLFAAAILTWYIEKTTRLFPESIVGVLFVTALAVGILITPEVDLLEALFGDITTVTLVDALLAVGISALVVVVSPLVYRRVVLTILSDELARSTGVNVPLVNFVYLLLVTIVVAVGIKIVGTVLVGALVIVPAAAVKNVSRSLSSYALLSGLTGIASAGSGILLADYLHLPAGPLVVTVGTAIFVGALVAGWIASRSSSTASRS